MQISTLREDSPPVPSKSVRLHQNAQMSKTILTCTSSFYQYSAKRWQQLPQPTPIIDSVISNYGSSSYFREKL
ncbi:hypothetical protein EXN66_Car002522 [Channa argus]|uniref:Uncharacterized protein n=1 Tax=Channa argus TaxID=215402 RepID=A0A6G1P969_CHAAH|nr:hypothetical protein EXN66_Car002522 [Channa argus]